MMPGRCWLAFADEDTIEMQNECTHQALVLKREVRGPQRRKYGAFTRHDCRETAINRGRETSAFQVEYEGSIPADPGVFHRPMVSALRSGRTMIRDHDPAA
jgi:hypothetical protein